MHKKIPTSHLYTRNWPNLPKLQFKDAKRSKFLQFVSYTRTNTCKFCVFTRSFFYFEETVRIFLNDARTSQSLPYRKIHFFHTKFCSSQMARTNFPSH